jgi:hypothetical protein
VLGIGFVLLGVRMVQARGRDWLPAAYLVLAVATLGWWNASNPEATVVETNLDRAAETGKLDVDYLDSMSDDAMPPLLGGLDTIPPGLADQVRERICTRPAPDADPYGDAYDDDLAVDPFRGRAHVEVDEDGVVRARPGWAAFNVSRQASVDAVQGCADALVG